MWPFKSSKKEIKLTIEEQEAVDREWKLFTSAMPKEEGPGEWYAPKEVVETMQKTIASEALMSLAERYLMEKNSSLTAEGDKNPLSEKAVTAAMKAVAIDAHPLNLYKVGNVLEKVGKLDEAKTFFREFLAAAPNLLKDSNENFRTVVKYAVDDINSKKIL